MQVLLIIDLNLPSVIYISNCTCILSFSVLVHAELYYYYCYSFITPKWHHSNTHKIHTEIHKHNT